MIFHDLPIILGSKEALCFRMWRAAFASRKLAFEARPADSAAGPICREGLGVSISQLGSKGAKDHMFLRPGGRRKRENDQEVPCKEMPYFVLDFPSSSSR